MVHDALWDVYHNSSLPAAAAIGEGGPDATGGSPLTAESPLGAGGTAESMIETSCPNVPSPFPDAEPSPGFSLPPANPTLPSPSGLLPTFPAPKLTLFLPRPIPKPIPNSLKLPPIHHPTPPTTLSRTLRFIIHPTQRRKKRNAARIKSRSYQSAFSSCLIN